MGVVPLCCVFVVAKKYASRKHPARQEPSKNAAHRCVHAHDFAFTETTRPAYAEERRVRKVRKQHTNHNGRQAKALTLASFW